MDGVWTLAVRLPADICAESFVAATIAENVPWLHEVTGDREQVTGSEDGLAAGGMVRVPFGLGYSDEEQEQPILVAAKVVYYLRGEDLTGDQEAETADDAPAPADGLA